MEYPHLVFFMGQRNVNVYSLKPLCGTETNHAHSTPRLFSPSSPFCYFLEVRFDGTSLLWTWIPQPFSGPLFSACQVPFPALLTKLAALGPTVEQAHGDVPASSSVYCGMAGLLAFQILPGDVTVRCLHHCHSIIPYRKDATKIIINISGTSQSICFQQIPLSS